MRGSTSIASKFSAAIVLIFNFLTMILCLVAFGVSLWAIASPSSLVYAVQVLGSPALKALVTEDALNVQLGVAGAVLAAFFFFISLMGFYGAMTGSQFLLFMYGTLVILLLLLECALMFYFSSNIIEKGVKHDEYWTHALRLSLRCCDRNYTVLETATPPWSCCGVSSFPKNCTSENVYKQDCQEAVIAWLHRHQTSIYVTFAVVHILLSCCCFVRRSLSRSQPHAVT